MPLLGFTACAKKPEKGDWGEVISSTLGVKDCKRMHLGDPKKGISLSVKVL